MRVPRWIVWLATVGAYVGAARTSAHWAVEGGVPLAWPAAGIGYSAVVLGGPWLAPAVGAGAFADALWAFRSPWVAVGIAVAAAGGALAGRLVLRRLYGQELGLVARALARIAAALAAAAATAAVATATFALADRLHGSGAHHLGLWFLGNLAGITVVSSFLRSWLGDVPAGVAGPLETAAAVVAGAGLAELVTSGALGDVGPVAYLVFPAVVWAGLRASQRGASTLLVAVSTIAVVNTAGGSGPFAPPGAGEPTVALNGYLLALYLCGLGFSALSRVRDASEAELRRSEQRFRALIENASDIVTVLAADGTVLYQSPSWPSVLGFTPEELVGVDVFEHIHADDLVRARDALARTVAIGEPVTVALRVRHKDGRWLDVVASGRNLLDDPAVRGIVVNSRDVTESRRAARRLAAAERRYRQLVEGLPLVTYVNGATPGDPPRYVSPQIEDMLGYPVARWYADAEFVEKVCHPDDRELVAALLAEPASVDVRHGEYRLVAADGRVVWVLDRMVTLCDERGEPTAVQGFLVDVSERKRLEEELRRAQRLEALGLLAGGVAHDFNNLLTAISGYAELARAHGGDAKLFASDLDDVRAAAERASRLTRQLLAFGRRHPLEPELVDINAVVGETAPLLGPLLGDGIELELRLDPRAGAVRADRAQLGQVLVNLAVNGRDAMAEGEGRLTVSTSRETIVAGDEGPPDDYVVVSVADTGAGIADDVRERLFEPFFTTKESGKGTGLGLAMVYGIVEQSNGRVVVRSALGEGAEFRVLLPRVDEAAAPEPPDEGRAPGGRETVLLVEDEDAVRRLTEQMLERQGYRVLSVGSPEAALGVAEPYELLLTDVLMPGMSGPELARRLAERRPDAAVLFVSGYSGEALGGDLGFAGDLLEKPFTLAQLSRRVRDALDRRSPVAAEPARRSL